MPQSWRYDVSVCHCFGVRVRLFAEAFVLQALGYDASLCYCFGVCVSEEEDERQRNSGSESMIRNSLILTIHPLPLLTRHRQPWGIPFVSLFLSRLSREV